MTGAVVIRRGAEGDRAYVRSLGRRVSSTSVLEGRAAANAMVELAVERLASFVFEQSHVLLIAQDGDERVGFLLLLDALPDEVTLELHAFVAYMAVEPAMRRRGIGRALIEAAQAEARARGLDRIALMVTESNVDGRGLYDACGFVTERRLLSKPL